MSKTSSQGGSRGAGRSRAAIRTILKNVGPSDASTMAEELGIAPMAVRQHLYALEELGDVCFTLVPRPKGRPAKLWQLTEQANAHFPNAHAEFSTELITSIKRVFGEEGMEKLLDVRLEKQISDYSNEISASSSLSEKLSSLSAIRTREGYMSDVLPGENPNEYMFVENNCPVCDAAKECTGICARELDLFSEVLGEEVTVERSEHLIEGARRCAYQISKQRR